MPVDIDEFREELARRINAFVAERQAQQAEEDAGEGAETVEDMRA